MATSAATKLPVVWPGTSSQLTSGAGGAVSMGQRISLTGSTLDLASSWDTSGGLANPYGWWKCNDASGSTTLVDSGTGGNNATLANNENTDWYKQSFNMYRNTASVHWVGTNVNNAGANATISTAASSSLTLLATVAVLRCTQTSFALTTTNANGPSQDCLALGWLQDTNDYTPPKVYAVHKKGGVEVNTAVTTGRMPLGALATIACVWTNRVGGVGNSTLEVWVNGVSIVSVNDARDISAMTVAGLMYLANAANNLGFGDGADLRIYKVALSASDIRAYDRNARRL